MMKVIPDKEGPLVHVSLVKICMLPEGLTR